MPNVSIIIEVDGENIAKIPCTVRSKDTKLFSSGSSGFNATGKIAIGQKDHQLGFNLIEIGSKPVEDKK